MIPMRHADSFEASGLSLSNLSEGQCFAFAVCVRKEIHAWLIAQKKDRLSRVDGQPVTFSYQMKQVRLRSC